VRNQLDSFSLRSINACGRVGWQESIRRCLDPALEEVKDPPVADNLPIRQTSFFDSLDEALQDMEDITNDAPRMNALRELANPHPDPESQYTASHDAHEEPDTNTTPSPGQGKKSSCQKTESSLLTTVNSHLLERMPPAAAPTHDKGYTIETFRLSIHPSPSFPSPN
jgi:hypothetical protein